MLDQANAINIFISYSRSESATADALVSCLESRGFQVTIDRRDLPYGEEWQHELTDFIVGCDTVVWLVSPASVCSRWVNWELSEVRRLSKRLMPVVIEKVKLEELPIAIREIHLLPAQGVYSEAEHSDVLVAALESDRDWIKEHTRLGDRAREWVATGRRSDRLLRGAALRDAETWRRDHPSKAPPPANDVLELLVASERGAKQRLRYLIGALALVLIATAGLAAFALLQRDNAVFALAQSKAAEFAARARSTATSQAMVATVLALRSVDALKDYGLQSAEGESALRTALAQMHGKNAYCLPNLVGGFPDAVQSLDISVDNKLVAVGTAGNAVCIYGNSPNGPLVLIDALQSYGAPVEDVRFSADGKRLFTTARPGHLRTLDLGVTVLDPKSQKFVENQFRFDRIAGRDQVEAISFDGAAKRLALFDRASMTLEVRSLIDFDPDGQPTAAFKLDGAVLATAFSNDGAYLAALVADRSINPFQQDSYHWRDVKAGLHIQLWNLASGQSRVIAPVLSKLNDVYIGSEFIMGKVVGDVEVGPRGEWVAASIGLVDQHRMARQHAAEVWNISDLQPESVLLFNGAYEDRPDGLSRVTDMGFTPDGAWFYGSSGPELRLWKLEGKRLSSKPIVLSSPYASDGSRRVVGDIYRTAVAPDSSQIATVGSNGALTVWNLLGESGPSNSAAFVVEREDSKFGKLETLRFSPDSGTVAIGGDGGAVKLCSTVSACSSLEPSLSFAPPTEGQWKQLWMKEDTWVAAVSEADRLWFWRPDQIREPFLAANISADNRRQKLIKKEYAVSSGTPGSPIALLASPEGSWATAFVMEQYGFNESMSLLRLDNYPAQYRVDIQAMECTGDRKGKSFRTVSLDPYWKRAYFSHSLSGCTASVALPAVAESAESIKPDHEVALGSVPIAYSKHFIAAHETGSSTSVCLWTRHADSGRPQDCILRLANGGSIVLSSSEWIFTIEGATDSRDEPANQTVHAAYRQASGALGPWQNLLSCACSISLEQSPDHRWLVAIAWKQSSDATISLWRIGEVAQQAAQWNLAAGGAKLKATFSNHGNKLIVAPTTFPVTFGQPAPPSLKALAIDLKGLTAKAQEFDVNLSNAHVSCIRSDGFSCEPIEYDFSSDGKWLSSSNPGNLWRFDGPAPHFEGPMDIEAALFSPDSRWLATTSEKGTSLRHVGRSTSDDRGLLGTGRARGFLPSNRLLLISDGVINVHRTNLDDLKQSAANALGRNPTPSEWRAAFGDEPYAQLFAGFGPSVEFIDELLDQAAQAQGQQKSDIARDGFAHAAALAVETKNLSVCMAVAEQALKAGYSDQALVAAKFAAELAPKIPRVIEFQKKVTASTRHRTAESSSTPTMQAPPYPEQRLGP